MHSNRGHGKLQISLEQAKVEHQERLDGETYFSLIPEQQEPPRKG